MNMATGKKVKMKIKKCLNCRKKLIGKYFTAKFCDEKCGREYRSKHKNKKKYEIKNMKKKCQFKYCKETATCVINKQFLCVTHFKTARYELKHQSLLAKCLYCKNIFYKNPVYSQNQKFC